MWIDIALYTSAFSVFLISMFIIVNYVKSKELQNKLVIYEEILEGLNQDIAILKKVVKTQNSNQNTSSNVNMPLLESKMKAISKTEINNSLVPIAAFVKNFSASFKNFEVRIDDKINAIAQNQTFAQAGYSDENLDLGTLQYNTQNDTQNDTEINQGNKLNKQRVIFDMKKEGLSLEEIESRTGVSISEIRFILNLQANLQ